jgi:hypothetical protein
MILYDIIIINGGLALHEGLRHTFSFWDLSKRGEVMSMDMEGVLTLMIAFGALVALIMSEKSNK